MKQITIRLKCETVENRIFKKSNQCKWKMTQETRRKESGTLELERVKVYFEQQLIV